MTTAEALRLVAMLAAFFHTEISDETGALWASELRRHELGDGVEAARQLGLGLRFLPALSEFIDAIAEVRNERLQTERKPLPAGSTAFCSFGDWLRDYATEEQKKSVARLSPKLVASLKEASNSPEPGRARVTRVGEIDWGPA